MPGVERPVRVRVGPIWFKVRWDEDAFLDAKDADGWIRYRSHVIRIRSTLRGTELVRVFLHEVAHAIMSQVAGRPARPTAEQVADAYSWGLVLFWQHNPDAMAWCADALGGQVQMRYAACPRAGVGQ